MIPAKSNRLDPITHDRAKYKWRNLVERLFNKPKNWRRVATRYDETKESYPGFFAIASIKLWIPFVHDNLANHTGARHNCGAPIFSIELSPREQL